MSSTSAPLRVRVARERGGATVVLDLAGLDFVDASGISVLLSAQRALAARGSSLGLRAPSRMVRKVLRLLDLDAVLQVET